MPFTCCTHPPHSKGLAKAFQHLLPSPRPHLPRLHHLGWRAEAGPGRSTPRTSPFPGFKNFYAKQLKLLLNKHCTLSALSPRFYIHIHIYGLSLSYRGWWQCCHKSMLYHSTPPPKAV